MHNHDDMIFMSNNKLNNVQVLYMNKTSIKQIPMINILNSSE
mgnify:CR=1 FL=1